MDPTPLLKPPSTQRSTNPLVLILALSGVFFAVFVALTGALYLGGGSGKSTTTRAATAPLFGTGVVGVLEVNGVILDSKRFLKKLAAFEEDSAVKAIVLRINSPGGAVAPSQEMYEALRAIKKPVVASMASVAASGGYYIACAAKKIFANPGTITGSIGVIMEFANLERLYEWAKVKRFSIKTGRFKDSGADYRSMAPEERELIQGMVDDVLSQFKHAVATGRKLPMDQVTRLADGRIFSGAQAKAVKLVDELGTLEDAVAEAGKLGKIKGKPEVVYPDKPRKRFIETLLEDANRGDDDAGAEGSASSSWLQALGRAVGQGLGRSLLGRALSEPAELLGLRAPGLYWLWSGG